VSFGEVLRHLRSQATLSQEELAERTGLSVRGISDLERGARRAPHLNTVRLLADALAASEIERALLLSSARPPPCAPTALGESHHWMRAPHPLTRLIGREGQLATVQALLGREDVRLVTLTGAGGIGKTRLAVAVAMATAAEFADGVVFVDLAPLHDPDAVLATIATTLHIRETGPKLLSSALADTLSSRRLLLLLDNFEHVLPAAPAITELLQAAPGIKALVTSRQPLRVRGEREVLVPPLELPAPPRRAPSEDLMRSEAVTLFVERAQDMRVDFMLSDDDEPAVAEIVTRLDGLPLAIELVATWSRTLTPPVLAARLERRLPFLSEGARDAPARHHTMRDAIAWSYDLLQPEEQALFRRLSVFVGGWTLDTVAALDATDSALDRLAQLTRLVDQHLVRTQATPAGDLRYDMLATIREFAREQLIPTGEERAASERHAAIFLDLAEDVVPHLHGPRQPESLARLAVEHDNLRAAIDWSLAHGPVELAIKFGAHLWLFWFLQGKWTEGRTWLRRTLALCGGTASLSDAEATFGAGNLAGIQGDLQEAEELFTSSLALWRHLNSRSGTARALSGLGIVALHTGQFARAVALQREALPFFELPGDEPWAAHAISNLAIALVELGDIDAALAHAEEGLTRQQAYGENWATASGLIMLADVLLAKGEYRRAAAMLANALEHWATPNLMGFLLWPLAGLAKLASAAGRAIEAARLIGLHDALASEASAVANPYYQQFLLGAAELASEQLGERAFGVERDAARLTPPDCITPEALRIAHDLATSA
jgi:predicted ATPase/transcriptional regulator with XRE-family HTH domain